jgi:glycosyltransferase involved in cell wall biosynthesis
MSIHLYAKVFPPHEPPVHNGVVKAIHGLAMGLVAQGEVIQVLSEDRVRADIQTAFGYRHRAFANPNSRPSLQLAPELIEYVKTQMTSRDLMILNGGFHLSVYALAKLLKQRGIPYIMAPHLTYDRPMFAKSPYRKYLYWYLCERVVLNQAKAIQVLNRHQAASLMARGIHTPVIEVQNGFVEADVLPVAKLPWSIVSDRPPVIGPTAPVRLLFFGRLSRHIKGLDLLLEAFSALCNQTRQLPIELSLQGADAGDGAQLSQTAWDLGISDRVHFCPPNYTAPPTEIIAAHDILCLTSRSEGFGLAALEGMLAGRVLLVSACAGIAEHVHASGCGLVVQPTVKSIQEGLNLLLTCRDRWPEMGRRGQQYALDRLSWRTIAQQALPEYQAIMGRPATRQLIRQ